MKIGIIGATGRQGNFLLKKAISRGHEITAIVRSDSNDSINGMNVKVIKKRFVRSYL